MWWCFCVVLLDGILLDIVICFDYYLVIGFSESVGYDEVDQFVLLIVVQIDMVLVLELLV